MKRLILALAIFSCGYAAVSYAADDFLTQVAPKLYSQEDMVMLGNAIQKGLTTLPDGQKEAWSNPATGHSGYVEPVGSTSDGGKACRTIKIGNTDQGRSTEYQYQFCKLGTQWELATPPATS